jgi:hypothetical protein
MEYAPAEERVRQVFLGIGCDNDDRPVFCLYCPVDLDYVKAHLVKDIEQIILKVGIRLVDLVYEKDDTVIYRE